MNHYENLINALAMMARQDLNAAMLLEACLEFTASEIHNATADQYFKERFGERLHWIMREVINHM